jgi:hypothetical protein
LDAGSYTVEQSIIADMHELGDEQLSVSFTTDLIPNVAPIPEPRVMHYLLALGLATALIANANRSLSNNLKSVITSS